MKHSYHINGMTCNGCRDHVKQTLSKVEGVKGISIDLEKAEASIEMDSHIPIETFQKVMQDEGGAYSIHKLGGHNKVNESPKENAKGAGTRTGAAAGTGAGTGVFYCPMHCKGDKTYDRQGNCRCFISVFRNSLVTNDCRVSNEF